MFSPYYRRPIDKQSRPDEPANTNCINPFKCGVSCGYEADILDAGLHLPKVQLRPGCRELGTRLAAVALRV